MNYNMINLVNWIYIDKINWKHLSMNPNTIHLLEQNMDKNDWTYLSTNLN
jgi:hypothetical protein